MKTTTNANNENNDLSQVLLGPGQSERIPDAIRDPQGRDSSLYATWLGTLAGSVSLPRYRTGTGPHAQELGDLCEDESGMAYYAGRYSVCGFCVETVSDPSSGRCGFCAGVRVGRIKADSANGYEWITWEDCQECGSPEGLDCFCQA